jgi:hypothetical protein
LSLPTFEPLYHLLACFFIVSVGEQFSSNTLLAELIE